MKFLNIFKKQNSYNQDLKDLEISKNKLKLALDESIKTAESDINSTREFYERMKGYGIRRFDNFLNLCLYSSLTNIDLMLLTERIRLSNRRLEKLFNARIISMTVYEYLKDISDLLGFKLIGELNSNNYKEFIKEVKDLNSEFSTLKKNHDLLIKVIRNNASAHKSKNALELIHYNNNLDPNELFDIAIDVINLNIKLTKFTTKIYLKIGEEGEQNRKNSI